MRLLFSLIFLSVSAAAYAVEITVQAPCADSPWLKVQLPHDPSQSVGAQTIQALTAGQVAYVGTPSGIISIRETLPSARALEVVNDRSMRAYGWCFSLNGKIPDVLPDQVYPESANDEITWFFAYATYENGLWKDYCTPTHTTRPAYLCGDAQP